MSVYRVPPSEAGSITTNMLLKKMERHAYRQIFAGDNLQPLTYWYMSRVKGILESKNINVHRERKKDLLQYSLNTAEGNVRGRLRHKIAGSYYEDNPLYDKDGNAVLDSNGVQKMGRTYYVGESWLSRSTNFTYKYLQSVHNADAPTWLFVVPLDPDKYKRFNLQGRPNLRIVSVSRHREHEKIQQLFAECVCYHVAACESRKAAEIETRTNPSRLLDIELEKNYVSAFRRIAWAIGRVSWDPATFYMTRGSATGLMGAVARLAKKSYASAATLEKWNEERKQRTDEDEDEDEEDDNDPPLVNPRSQGVFTVPPAQQPDQQQDQQQDQQPAEEKDSSSGSSSGSDSGSDSDSDSGSGSGSGSDNEDGDMQNNAARNARNEAEADAAAAAKQQDISPYERARFARIAGNNAELAALGLSGGLKIAQRNARSMANVGNIAFPARRKRRKTKKRRNVAPTPSLGMIGAL